MTGGLDVAIPPFPRPLPELAVDTEQVADYGADLLAASSQVDDVGGYAAGTGRVVAWTGDAADAYRTELSPYGLRADAMSLALRGVARRVDLHAEHLGTLLAERADLVEEGRLLSGEIVDLEERVHDFHATAAAGGFGDVVLGERLLKLRWAATALSLRVQDVDGRSLAWRARVDAEARGMVAAFERVLEIEQVERAYGGRDDPADDAVDRMPGVDAPPEAVNRWWEALTAVEQAAVIAAAPGLIGGRDGIPAGARDDANRNRLERDLARLRMLARQGRLTPDEQEYLENAEAAAEALDRLDGDPVPSLLWAYDPEAFAHADGSVDGLVAISIGDPDTADSVAVNVAGLGADAQDIGTYVDRARELHRSAATADPSQSYASIAWLGYDAPEGVLDAAQEDRATAGGARLADALDGLVAGRDDVPRVVPIGHSYGSTTVGATLSDHDVDVGAAAVVGSPGLTGDVHDVGDLDLPEGELYVGRNHDDLVARLGQNGSLGTGTLGGVGLGHDPADGDFGGRRFQANAADGDDNHSSYYQNDSESLHNLGLIVAGEEPTPAGPVSDPWYWGAVDPEEGAASDRYDTDGDGDTDGEP